MDMRELKGLELAARCKIAFADGAWRVPSQAGSGKYCVQLTPGAESCECEDFLLRGAPCKHIHAARLVQERDYGGKAPPVDTDALPKRKKYGQNWPAYNLAQTTEKKRLQTLLAELCRRVPDFPPPRRGRKPHRAGDAVFAMAFKVYSTFSERRFSCDLADAHAQGHVSALIPGMKLHSFFEKAAFAPILQDLIAQSSLPLRAVETVFAPDSTGFSTSRFVRWYDEKYGVHRSGRAWVKAHVITGVKTNIVPAVVIDHQDAADSPQFKELVERTAKHFNVREVPADKAYLSHDNLELVQRLGGTAFVPFKVNSVQGEAGSLWEKMFLYYNLRREEFLAHYHQRSNVESTFSAVKAKFRDDVRNRTDVAMKNEVLCKFLCHNICCLIQSQYELGIEAAFWPQEQAAVKRDVLPMVRPG